MSMFISEARAVALAPVGSHATVTLDLAARVCEEHGETACRQLCEMKAEQQRKPAMYLDWDQWELRAVATVLHNTHTGYKERGMDTVEAIMDHIRYTAEGILYGGNGPIPTWCGTGGWYVLFVPISYADDGRWKALPFLQTYHVTKALNIEVDR